MLLVRVSAMRQMAGGDVAGTYHRQSIDSSGLKDLLERARTIAPNDISLRPITSADAASSSASYKTSAQIQSMGAAFEGTDSSGAVVWKAFITSEIAPSIVGYAGPVELLVGIDASETVTGVVVLHHTETPTFVSGIEESWFLDQFKGKSRKSKLVIGEDFDGIAQATVTIRAIRDGIRASLDRATGESVQDVSHYFHGSGIPWIAVALALILQFNNTCMPRKIVTGISALLIGFVAGQFLSFAHLQIFLRSPNAIIHLPELWLIFAVIAFLVIIKRPRGYCASLCPMGLIQETIICEGLSLTHISGDKNPSLQPFSISNDSFFPLSLEGRDSVTLPRGIGHTLFWCGLIATATISSFPGERLEVFSALFMRNQGFFGFLLAIFAIIGSIVFKRFYCRVLCPMSPIFEDLETLCATVRGRRSFEIISKTIDVEMTDTAYITPEVKHAKVSDIDNIDFEANGGTTIKSDKSDISSSDTKPNS
ncbi:MAG: FMN-binding protein [Candidatus Riflebacteria bacterium]|nr:FMN-binding protein [Candidatus Riflebacteria bacterium]